MGDGGEMQTMMANPTLYKRSERKALRVSTKIGLKVHSKKSYNVTWLQRRRDTIRPKFDAISCKKRLYMPWRSAHLLAEWSFYTTFTISRYAENKERGNLKWLSTATAKGTMVFAIGFNYIRFRVGHPYRVRRALDSEFSFYSKLRQSASFQRKRELRRLTLGGQIKKLWREIWTCSSSSMQTHTLSIMGD